MSDAHDGRGLSSFADVFEAIRRDPQNRDYTERGIDPLYTAGPHARIVIIGQAPGRVAEETRIPWNDKSGDRLREWLGIDRDTFYDVERLALLPMDFYFPGKGRGGDLPPRRGFAEKWHPVLLGMMPEARLVVLVGSYAVRRYLHLSSSAKLTDVVRGYRRVLDGVSGDAGSGGRGGGMPDGAGGGGGCGSPDGAGGGGGNGGSLDGSGGTPRRFPLVHPSPRNQLWMSRNPWFESEVLPDLRREVRAALG